MARPLVGLIPAAGRGRRLAGSPGPPAVTGSAAIAAAAAITGSKEVMPLPGRPGAVLADFVLARLAQAGVRRAYVVVAGGKWDVPARLGSGARHGLALAYLVTAPTPGVPHTLDVAYRFVRGCDVALGFPDLLFRPGDAFVRLRRELARGGDVVLGVTATDRPDKADIVRLDRRGRVRDIAIKPASARGVRPTWVAAVWTPRFTAFLHRYVAAARRGGGSEERGRDRERHVGDVVAAAIGAGLDVRGLRLPGGAQLDLGTPEDLARGAAFLDR